MTPTGNGDKLLNGSVFAISVAAFVALTLAGKPTDGLFVLVGPVISALFVTSALKPQLTRVEQQTNGVLDERIHRGAKAATAAALAEVGLVVPAVDPVTVPTPTRSAGAAVDERGAVTVVQLVWLGAWLLLGVLLVAAAFAALA